MAEPTVCAVTGKVRDSAGEPVADVRIIAQLPAPVTYAGEMLISDYAVEAVTDELGDFSISLVNNEKMRYMPNSTLGMPHYKFLFRGTGIRIEELRYVPDVPTKPYVELEILRMERKKKKEEGENA